MKIFKFILFFALFITNDAKAQWTEETNINTLVANSESEEMRAIGTSDGSTYIVFWKPTSTNYELRMQVLDALGNQQLGADGVLVTNNIVTSTPIGIFVKLDKDENIFVATRGTMNYSGYVFKMDIDGNHIWSSNGITLPDAAGINVSVFPLNNGDAIISWANYSSALMQRYDDSGNPLWPAPQPITNGDESTITESIFELSNGDFIVTFHSYSDLLFTTTLYAQRYNSNGQPQWASPTQLVNKLTGITASFYFGYTYKTIQDGDDIYMGYTGFNSNSSFKQSAFLLKLKPDGTLPWGINGLDFDVNQNYSESDMQIAMAPGSPYIWAVCNYLDTIVDPNSGVTFQYANHQGLTVQKFNKNTGVREFSDNAKTIYPVSDLAKRHVGNFQLLNDEPFFLITEGGIGGVNPMFLSGLMLDSNGDIVSPDTPTTIATYSANKRYIHLTQAVNGQAVAVWMEDKEGSGLKNIYAQNFTNVLTALTEIKSEHELKVFPNPAVNFASIEFYSPVNTDVQLTIYNSEGKTVVSSNEKITTGKNFIDVDVQQLPSGIYFYKMAGNSIDMFGKLSIAK